MREVFILAPLAGLLIAVFAPATSAADRDRERLIFVEPPLRVLTQCELETARRDELICVRNGWPRTVALTREVIVWRGRDSVGTGALRRGDILDIRMGLDKSGREVAQFIWANLVKVEGVVRHTGRGWIRVAAVITGTIGEVEERGVLVTLPRDTQFLGGATPADLRRDRAVIVIGRRVADGRVEAARVLAAGRE